MEPAGWKHLAVILEWTSFVLVTPGLLGEKGLQYISSFLRKSAVVFIAVPDLLTFGPFNAFKLEESANVVQVKKIWDTLSNPSNQRVLPWMILNVLAPAVLLTGAFALLRWPYRVVPIGILAVGLVSLALMMRRRSPFFLTIRLRMVSLYLLLFPISFFTAVFAFSFVGWLAVPSLLLARGLITLSESQKLRTYFFVLGVLMFSFSKLVEGWLV